MLKHIRNIDEGWLLSLMGLVIILAGFSMTEDPNKGNTLLCFDAGCVMAQGLTCIALGIFTIGIGIYARYFRYR